MNAMIKKIVLFSAEGEMREVPLENGLNIITGDSKTGKSALLEIVDYCLFSSRSTIPVGKITDFTELFCIILKIQGKYLVIARPKWGDEHAYAYLSVEVSEAFLETFSYKYFQTKIPRKIKYDVISELEEHLGLSVLDTRVDSEVDKRNAGKATMRSFIPFLFQHQNLIANKHSLFYRFDDFYKRKDTIDQFPILMGWVDNNYYSIKRLLEEKTKLLSREKKRMKSYGYKRDEQIRRLRIPIEQYYSSIGYVLEENLKLNELRKIAKTLPEVPRSSNEDSDIEFELFDLNDKISGYRSELSETKKLIKQVSDNSNIANTYEGQLQTIISSNSSEMSDIENLECPFCHSRTPEVEEIINSVNDSKEELIEELLRVGNYRSDSILHLESLIEKEGTLKKGIRQLTRKVKLLEDAQKEIQKENSLRDGLSFLRGQIQLLLDQILEEPTLIDSEIDIEELELDIKNLKDKIAGYDLGAKYEDANSFLCEKMTSISQKLDFEKELQPGKMRFDLRTFDFYYNYDGNNIMLSEMGSGANWLASHLALFLALLHLSCKEKNSVVPSFLFVDQPSQVYFPKATQSLSSEINAITDSDEKQEADENIVQVKNIFKVILEELNEISENYDFTPQIVVLEHADEAEFNQYVRRRWASKGEKLV